jgi:enoyl-CoA hydratase/carnithine racemase
VDHRNLALTYNEVGHCRVIDFGTTGSRSADLAELCDRIAWDEEARVVVLIFGNEVNDRLLSVEDSGQNSFVEPVARLKQPVLAAIRGDAIGLCLELALACDIRIGIENARFGLPQIREGSIPSNGGTQRLPRLIGQGKAMQLILTGERIDAAEACRMGLLNRVVASDTLASTVMDMAQDMAAKSPLSLSYVKEALYAGRDLTLDQGLRMELDLYLLLFTGSDRIEGITAFRDKRKPDFRGI